MTLVQLTIPQPCHEKWEGMTPTATGRHCAACQKTVIDFTQMSDAEILAHLARAMGETCGQLRPDQLGRALLPAAPVSARHSWRTWLVAGLTVWGLREGAGLKAAGQVVRKTPACYAGQQPGKVVHTTMPTGLLHGSVYDSVTQRLLPGVAVFLAGENRSATTDSAGRFQLRLPARRPKQRKLIIHCFGYHSQTVKLGVGAAALHIELGRDVVGAGVEVTAQFVMERRQVLGGAVSQIVMRPTPSLATRGRSLWRWLTHPFRRS